jgi:hypothetical protein
VQTVIFASTRKFIWQQITPLQKRIRNAPRKVMCQKTMVFIFSSPEFWLEKQLNAATKIYTTESTQRRMVLISFTG